MATKATSIEFLLTQARNATGSLAGGTVTVAAAGDATSTPITIWLDRNKATPAANPYTLDSNGTAQLYADGLIKVVVKNAAGTTVYTRDNLNYVDYLTSGAYQAIDADYASLNAAITAIGSTPTTLLIRTASFPMTGAAVVPTTLKIKMEYPGSIAGATYALTTNGSLEVGPGSTINTSGAITINGPFSAPDSQVFVGSGAVTFPQGSTVRSSWWGETAAAVQKAIDSGYVTGVLNPGYITVIISKSQTWDTAIDLTTRDFVHLKANSGVVITSTSTNYVIDATSLAYSTFENLIIDSSTATVGIYFNRGTPRPTAEFNKIINCNISLTSHPTYNSNTGTIALYNSRAELLKVTDSQFYADVPVLLEYKTRAYLAPLYETEQAFGTGWDSATVMSFADCTFNGWGTYAPPMYIDNVVGLECLNCYWRHSGISSGSNTYAIVTNNLYRSKFTGSVETWPQFLHSLRIANGLEIDITIQGGTLNTAGVINVDSVSTDVGGITASDINVLVTDTPTAGSSVVFGSRDGAHTYIKDNRISSTITAINTTDTALRLSRVVAGNIENTSGTLMVDNIRTYRVSGAYIGDGVSLTYTIPDDVGAVEITAAFSYISGSTDNQNITVLFTRNDGDAGRLITKASTIVGTANRISAALGTGEIVFTTSATSAISFVGYEIKEFYGDKI